MSDVGHPAPDDLFSDNHRWGDLEEWNRTALSLHSRGGVHRIERRGFTPFWAVIDHVGVLEVERQPELFTNSPEPVLQQSQAINTRQTAIKSLIHMDGAEHRAYRRLTSDWFKPAGIRRLTKRLDELSRGAVASMVEAGGECDFVADVAVPYPLRVILEVLGLPEQDYDRMLTLTQQLFGQEDPDMQRGKLSPEVRDEIIGDFYTYFSELTNQRRSRPLDDLATLIANGTIANAPMPDLETMGYYVIVATAGHDTTSSAMAGGLHALIENPDQLALLRSDPDRLMANAVEEMLRWTAPVRHFMRTAQADTELCGQQIKQGDWLYLSYKAANLDPKVFDDPLRFDIQRNNADRNVSFGYGVHFCLGAQLARNELRSLFGHLVPRLAHIELAGAPATMKTTFVGGHTRLPIRYQLT